MRTVTRRTVLRTAGVLGVGAYAAPLLAAERMITPAQTAGPFYPVPPIAQQTNHDTDLTKKMGDDEVAKGEIIVVEGRIVDVAGKPIKDAVVEIWQACTSGKYNHARDDNPAALDDNFQFWGRMQTSETGAYSFRTIKPGEYPGRTPHIHYHVAADGFARVITQLYFAEEAKSNERDGIYRRLGKAERDAVTVEFAKSDTSNGARTGSFELVLGKA